MMPLEIMLGRADFTDEQRWLMILFMLGEAATITGIDSEGMCCYKWVGQTAKPDRIYVKLDPAFYEKLPKQKR